MLEAVLALLIGLLIGSFLNVCIYRMPRDLSIVSPARSFCPACEHTIAWYDNIPLLSYALLRGRCRHCSWRIPLRYPFVELFTGILFFFFVLVNGPSLMALKMCIFSALLVGLIFSDLEELILPDEFTLGGAVIGVIFAYVLPFRFTFVGILFPLDWPQARVSVAESVIGALFPAFMMWALGELYYRVRHKEGLGLGDVKMIGMVGAFFGLQGAMGTLMLGSILGSVIGLLYIYVAKKDASTYELPFGTFLGAGGLVVGLMSMRWAS